MANAKLDGDADHRDATISRREFIQGVIATSAAAGVAGLSGVGLSASPSASETTVLTAEQGRTLTRILNHLIPAEGAMPGAGDLGVASYIDSALAAAPHLRHHFFGVLGALPDADRLYEVSAAELHMLLQRIEREHSESFDLVLEATYCGYYSHPRVQTALGWLDFEQLPDPFEPFDVTLLDAVRKRGPLFEDV